MAPAIKPFTTNCMISDTKSILVPTAAKPSGIGGRTANNRVLQKG
jgi:hypothetical protein